MQVLERLHPGYGIAVVRIMAGIILLAAGVDKLMGPGVAGITRFFGSVGIPAPGVMAPLLIGFEVIGGLLLIVGVFSRYLGAIMVVQFLVAGLVVSMPSQMGWMAARTDFLMGACGAMFVLAGSGLLSVDVWMAARRPSSARAAAPSL